MAQYGGDYTSGRYTRRNVDEFGMGYDSDYVGGSYGYGSPTGRGYGWRGRERGGWGRRERGRERGDLDESWGSAWPRRTRYDYGEASWGGYGGRGESGWFGGEEYDRDLWAVWRPPRYGYGEDYREPRRQRRSGIREETRGWRGRGYDLGW